jgi:hypothetical protein
MHIEVKIPIFLSHYFDASTGPFKNLSMLNQCEARDIMTRIRHEGKLFASQRPQDYLEIRRELEARVRQLFIAKGGKPILTRPHYMILGASPWLKDWYENGSEVRIPLVAFSKDIVSFTYGDTFPAMRFQDGKPYRGQVYTLEEIPDLITSFGLPQEWNPDGEKGPDRYIEAQIWDERPLKPFMKL